MSFIPDPQAARRAGAGRSAETHATGDDSERWSAGAAGEQSTAALLQPLALTGWAVLHDRALPGSGANLDHLACDGSNLWVIDTKVWRGDVVRLGDCRLWYADSPVTESLEAVRFLVTAAQRTILRHSRLAELMVRPVVCIHGATLPESPIVEAGITLVSPADIVPLLARLGPGRTTGAIRGELARAFPPRTRQHVDTNVSIKHPQKRNTPAPVQEMLPLQWP